MKWTLDWLQEYLKTDASASKIADTLTRTGLEVEDVVTPVVPIAAKIIECHAHENSNHLHVLKVDDGSGTLRQVVCGAPNARVGLVSALAVPGCVIDGHEIQSGKLRGVLSDGMMCSGRELGINNDHSGILELSPDMVPGTAVLPAYTVFEAGITPNRPDYLSVRGIARDLSASGIGEYVCPSDEEFYESFGTRRVNILSDKCGAYKLTEIHGVTVAPSDPKIAARLAAIGIKPKNAPVDMTNYVCYDMGQPMHCFDADEISGDITVRNAVQDEKFTDLFGTEHTLTTDDLVIADDAGILALAGVIGGARGSTTSDTKNIILESAYFDSVSVRRTSKRLGISTDASYRYERGIDPTMTGRAAVYAARNIIDVCGGTIVGAYSAQTSLPMPQTISYNPDYFTTKTGISLAQDIQRDILVALGYTVDYSSNPWRVTPLASRVDVKIPETIVADLIRIYGYDKLLTQATYHTTGTARPHTNNETDIKNLLASRGLNECRSFGFGNKTTEQLLSDRPNIVISNPITSDYDTLRNGLLFGLLLAVSNNEKRGYPDLSLFELGVVFDGDLPGQQHTSLCLVRTGANAPRHWTGRNRDVDIYDVKADLISLFSGQRFTISTENAPLWAHPYRYGALYQGKKKIAEFGQLHPSVAKKLRIKTNTVIALVEDITNIPARRGGKQPVLSDFQPITRDFAFITDTDTPADKITSIARSADSRITDVVVFDSFDMGDDKKSIAFTITIQPNDNMSDADLLKIQNTVIDSVEKKCNAKIRDK